MSDKLFGILNNSITAIDNAVVVHYEFTSQEQADLVERNGILNLDAGRLES